MLDPRNAVVGYADMVGDLLHWGHVRFLRECKRHCEYLVVGVDNDDLVKENKREPIIPFSKRFEVVESIRYVDEVRDSLSWNPAVMLEKLYSEGYNLKRYFHGNDRVDPRAVEYIESIGGNAVITSYIEGVSTSTIIQTILEKFCKY
jgi:cytidyltransferase-like protein